MRNYWGKNSPILNAHNIISPGVKRRTRLGQARPNKTEVPRQCWWHTLSPEGIVTCKHRSSAVCKQRPSLGIKLRRDELSWSKSVWVRRTRSLTPDTWAEKIESFERINSIRVTNWNFDSCNSCKRLVSRLHELHESKFPLVIGTYRIRPFETFEIFCPCNRGFWSL